MLPSSTVENYLKAIYLGVAGLEAPQRLLPMGQLAAALGVAPGTATTMVKTLAESGLVQYEPYAGVALTAAGEKLAALVVRRHRVVELFLVQVMGYGWDEVHDEAEQLEHAVSERLIDRMDEMLGRPGVDPHGDPIPDATGVVKPQEAQSLLTCPINVPVKVTRVIDQDKAFLRFIERHNLKPGESIEVEHRDDASDSVRVRGKDDQRITIGTRAASKLLVHIAHVLFLALLLPGAAAAQTTAMLRGVVADEQGGALPGTQVRVWKAITGLERVTTTGPDGRFQIPNVPLDTYALHVELPGFTPHRSEVDLRTSVPVDLSIVLALAAQSSSITVVAENPILVDATSAGTRNQISMARIAQLPAAVGSRGLESALVTFPGFAQNANGAIHPRGAHNQMTFVIDGLPIGDQLTGAFANALDAAIVQSAELMTGNIPAEFGGKVSGVAVVTSRSGLGIARRLAGDATVTAAGHDTWHGVAQAGGGGPRLGYFGSMAAMRTDRFLDQVSLDNLHNTGGFARGFGRVDIVMTERDMLRLHAMGGSSRFEVANLRSQDAVGQDQRQALSDAAAWVSYLRTIDARSTLESTVGHRVTRARLTPSRGDTPVTAAQRRGLATTTAAARYTRLLAAHTLRAGFDVQRFPVREHFTMGITRATFNEPGTPFFNPALVAHDLTRGGVPFVFDDERTGTTWSGFAQATLRVGEASLALGLRHDTYRFLVRGAQLQPRLGVAYRLPGSMGVLRASYNRNYQTPPNENLLLSASEQAARLAPAAVSEALGGGLRPILPERQNVYEAGYQRSVGSLGTVDASVYRKTSRDQQDNNNFFDTGIIFPTTLAGITVDGAELRLNVAPHHGVSGTLSVTAGRAISRPPFTGGLFLGQAAVDLLSAGPFPIDHDQRLSAHGTAQFDAPGCGWVSGSLRYDSGLVSNPSDPAQVAADPDFADLLPYVDLTAHVPRVRPRTIADVAAGCDLTTDGQRTWGLQLQITNLTDRTALYNFQSVFVGTRLVQPRTFALRVKRYF
jgi:Mn-dependent DtxR family transcriptional regulator